MATSLVFTLFVFNKFLGSGPNATNPPTYAAALQAGTIDIALLLLAIFGGKVTITRLRARETSPLVDAGFLMAIAVLVSTALQPSDRGVAMSIRLFACVVAADRLSLNPGKIGRLVSIAAIVEFGIVVFQQVTKRTVGLWLIGESDPVPRFGQLIPRGTFHWMYPMGCFFAISAAAITTLAILGHVQPKLALVINAMAGTAAMVSFSRVAVLTVALHCAWCLLLVLTRKSSRRFLAGVILAAVFGGLLGGLASLNGWRNRVVENSGSMSRMTSERDQRLIENIRVLRKYPIIGVGTGRYSKVVFEQNLNVEDGNYAPPHIVPLAALTETGLLAVPSLLAAAGAFALVLWRREWERALPLVCSLPILFLEQFCWNYPECTMFLALLFGVAGLGVRWKSRRAAD